MLTHVLEVERYPAELLTMELAAVVAQSPTSYVELKATIEVILERTEWPTESNEAAQLLLRVVQHIPSNKEFSYIGPQKGIRAVQNASEKVKRASLICGMKERGPLRRAIPLSGEVVKTCTRILTTCREELISNFPEAAPPKTGPFRWPSKLRREPPPTSTLRDSESQQQSSSPRAQPLRVYVSSRPAPLAYDLDSDAEQQRVSPSSEGSAVSISSTKATLGPITVVGQQEAVARAPRIRHRPPPSTSTLRDGRSQQHSSTLFLPPPQTAYITNRDPDSEEEDLMVPLHSGSRQALTLRGDENQQHRSSLRGRTSAPSGLTHRPLVGIVGEDGSDEESSTTSRHGDGPVESSAPPRHTPRPLTGIIEYDSKEYLPFSGPRTIVVASEEQQLASLGEEGSVVSASSSIPSSDSVADVGTRITWISPTPVKSNGRFCDLFAGTHSGVGKVVLKRPRVQAAGNNEDVMRRFQREAETWKTLQHPHILECLGTFQRDGHFYFVSPFIEHGTLVEYIVLHPSVNRIKLLCETADAISYLHKEAVVHGDIKASSLLIGDSGQVLLCGSTSDLTMPADVRTSTGVKGTSTLRWQSPELLNGGSKSFKSDVYAFGMTIAEVLTGNVPFHDLPTDGDVINAVLVQARRPPRNPTVSSVGLSYRKVWAIAKACWRTIPEKRIAMSEALQMIQEETALTAIQADGALLAIEDITSSSSFVGDIGSFITSISKDVVRSNGHFCDVFEGVHLTAGRVALKRPRGTGIADEAEIIRRFEREAATWRSLRHPHILQFLGTFRRDRHLYLVSPFINNGTLVEYIARHPETNCVRLLCETADALNYLHQNGVVHGDIKGGNILIDDNIHSLLCDFGLTKVTHSRTSTAMRGAGTFRWQSPELWFDEPKSFSSDAYAFAMTIVEILTGDAPFAHLKNDTAVMFAVVNNNERPAKAPSKSLSGVSYLGAWDVAEACWSKKPEERISMSVAFQRLQADPSSS